MVAPLFSEAYCVRIVRRRQRVAEQRGRVFVTDLRDLVRRQSAEDVAEDLLRVGPRAVTVWIVRFECDVVDADRVTRAERGRVVDRCEPEVAVEHFRGAQVAGKIVSVTRAVDDVLE